MSLTGGDGSPCSVAWSPDGTQLALGSGGVLKVWSMPAGKELLTLKDNQSISGVVWSHDGKRLAASVGMLLKVWDPRSGKELLALPNDRDISSVDWTPLSFLL